MKVLCEIQQSFKNTLWVPPPTKTIVPSSRIDTEVKSHEKIFLHLSAKSYLEKMCLVHKRTEVIISSNSKDKWSFSNVSYSNIFHSVPVQPWTAIIIQNFRSVYGSLMVHLWLTLGETL